MSNYYGMLTGEVREMNGTAEHFVGALLYPVVAITEFGRLI